MENATIALSFTARHPNKTLATCLVSLSAGYRGVRFLYKSKLLYCTVDASEDAILVDKVESSLLLVATLTPCAKLSDQS